MQEFGQLYGIVLAAFKGYNRSQLKQTSLLEQTIRQICDLDGEDMGAVIKLLYSENIAVLRPPADVSSQGLKLFSNWHPNWL
jgi:hypothetical protein